MTTFKAQRFHTSSAASLSSLSPSHLDAQPTESLRSWIHEDARLKQSGKKTTMEKQWTRCMSRYRVSNRGFGTERLTENQGKSERNIYVFVLLLLLLTPFWSMRLLKNTIYQPSLLIFHAKNYTRLGTCSINHQLHMDRFQYQADLP